MPRGPSLSGDLPSSTAGLLYCHYLENRAVAHSKER